MAYSKRQLASGSRKMRFFLLLVGLAAAAEVRPGAQLRSSHHQRAPRATPSSRRSPEDGAAWRPAPREGARSARRLPRPQAWLIDAVPCCP